MQIIQGLLIAAALIAIVLLLIVALGLLAFGIAAERRKRKMIERLKYWLFQKGKGCHHCCIRCEYFDICR